MFVVAHRLSTNIDTDVIFFPKDREIVEEGTHYELIEKEGEYYRLWQIQNRRE